VAKSYQFLEIQGAEVKLQQNETKNKSHHIPQGNKNRDKIIKKDLITNEYQSFYFSLFIPDTQNKGQGEPLIPSISFNWPKISGLTCLMDRGLEALKNNEESCKDLALN
jgi:hypothetical protein